MKRVNSVYILHVSDFHISEESKGDAESVLKALAEKLGENNICVSYLIHTGDIINSSDLEQNILHGWDLMVIPEERLLEYDGKLKSLVSNRFGIAKKIMEEFIKNLGVSNKNVIICCGNHDKVRYRKEKNQAFQPFEDFLDGITSHKELTSYFELDDINVLVMNTNFSDDKRVTCLECNKIDIVLEEQLSSEREANACFYTNKKKKKHSVMDENRDKVNIIVAHQPLYDVCEYARLPYSNETQTTDFLSALQDFIKGNGIYLCGDKHTSSIAASYIHDIPHYFCGHPFTFKETQRPECCKKNSVAPRQKEIEYNLIEIREGRIGEIKKIHLSDNNGTWKCEIHPIDTVVAELYEKSRKHIAPNSFALIERKSRTRYKSLKNLSWHNLSKRLDEIINSQNTLKEISDFHRLFCNLKGRDLEEKNLKDASEKHIFEQLNDVISDYFNSDTNIQNIINVRGNYSSGKSTFLGILYMYLLHCYSL